MKYEKKLETKKSKLEKTLTSVINDLSRKKLKINEESVTIPDDLGLDLKLKYEDTPEKGSFAIKICWDYPVSQQDADKEL